MNLTFPACQTISRVNERSRGLLWAGRVYGAAIGQYLLIGLVTSRDRVFDVLSEFDRAVAERRRDLIEEFDLEDAVAPESSTEATIENPEGISSDPAAEHNGPAVRKRNGHSGESDHQSNEPRCNQRTA